MSEEKHLAESIPDLCINDGWFAVPHHIYKFPIKQTELRLMIALLKLENRMTSGKQGYGEWFYANNKQIIGLTHLSETNIKKARNQLAGYSWIEFKKGYSHHSTDYRILLRGYLKTDPMKTIFGGNTNTTTLSNESICSLQEGSKFTSKEKFI